MTYMVTNEPQFEQIDAEQADLLKTAKERYRIAKDGWHEYLQSARDTLKFIAGDQWDDQLRTNRENAGLPALTANKLSTFLRQITNEVRQNTPSIQIDPKDGGANEGTAEVIADLIRSIEDHSGADTAYDTAAYYAAAVGLGYFRVVSEYESADSFSQRLVIKAVMDPETVLLDPIHRDPTGCDSEYGFIITTMSKDSFLRQYPEARMSMQAKSVGWTTNYTDWVREDEVLIAEYYWKDYEEKVLKLVHDTRTDTTYTTTDDLDEQLLANNVIYVIRERTVMQPIIRWAKMNDVEVLEQTVWPGTYIPIVAVKGDEIWVSGKRIVKGAAQDALDSQRAFNYFLSIQAELVQLAPKAPFIGEIRQFANFEHLWRDANVAPNAYLPYNSVEGLPPPSRQTAEVPIQAAMSMCAQASDSMKSIFGIFDASLGAHGNETSGKAILARQQQSHTTNYHFYDNLIRSIVHLGHILIEAIPVFYDDERLLQVTTKAGDKRSVMVNSFNPQKGMVEHDLTTGKYGVVVQTGPSYATRRQEAVQSMIALGQAYPQAMPIISDIMVNNMDWPGAKEIAARLHAAVPPNILQATEGSDGMEPEQVVQQLKMQLQQQGQQLQALNAHAQQVEQELKLSQQELELVKQDKSIELKKADEQFTIKQQELKLSEEQTGLEMVLQLRKLELETQKLQLERERLNIESVNAAAGIARDVHDATLDHLDRGSFASPSLDSDLGGDIAKDSINVISL